MSFAWELENINRFDKELVTDLFTSPMNIMWKFQIIEFLSETQSEG